MQRLDKLIQALRDQEASLGALQTADLATMCARDIAVHRGEKVQALVAAMMWQGMLEQSQANWDSLHDAPRASVRSAVASTGDVATRPTAGSGERLGPVN